MTQLSFVKKSFKKNCLIDICITENECMKEGMYVFFLYSACVVNR